MLINSERKQRVFFDAANSWKNQVVNGQGRSRVKRGNRSWEFQELSERKPLPKGTLRGQKVDRKWVVFLPGTQNSANAVQNSNQKSERRSARGYDSLIRQLQSQVGFLESQLVVKDEQLRSQLQAKDQQLTAKDMQIAKLYEDIESWREQVRYKELQIAQLQDRMIQLPPTEEPEPTEQGSAVQERAVPQTAASGNVVSRFWRWFVGG
jgi:hypothetical protein